MARMLSSTLVAFAVGLVALGPACSTRVYQVETLEARRAARELAEADQVVVEAHTARTDSVVRIRLYASDEVDVEAMARCESVRLDSCPDGQMEMHQLGPSAGDIRSITVRDTNWGPLWIIGGSATFASSYMITGVATAVTDDKSYLIPIYGPIVMSTDMIDACEGLGCLLVPFGLMLSLAALAGQIMGPVFIGVGVDDLSDSREVE